MKLLDSLTYLANKIKALTTKTAELDGKVTALESKTIDEATISQLKSTIKSEIVGEAPQTLDTLKEIADYIETDKTTGASLATAIANRVRYDEAQVLTPEQKRQALTNIGADDMTVDFLAELKKVVE